MNWLDHLPFDPLPALLTSGSPAVEYFACRDLLKTDTVPPGNLRTLDVPVRLIRIQREDGGWKNPGAKAHLRACEDYDQIETFRNLGILVEKYGFQRDHASIKKTAGFLLACQTDEGDFRGIYGNQYSPNYSAAILELLIKAGYENDPQILRGLDWLLSMRQADGGWAIPMRTRMNIYTAEILAGPTLLPDLSRPFSHMVTGVVLRALAAHREYRGLEEVQRAGRLLASRILKRDAYPERGAVYFWTSFSFPFWFTDLLSALDSLSILGFPPENSDIKRGLDWLRSNQNPDGTWTVKMLRNKDKDLRHWLGLGICKVFQRLYPEN